MIRCRCGRFARRTGKIAKQPIKRKMKFFPSGWYWAFESSSSPLEVAVCKKHGGFLVPVQYSTK